MLPVPVLQFSGRFFLQCTRRSSHSSRFFSDWIKLTYNSSISVSTSNIFFCEGGVGAGGGRSYNPHKQDRTTARSEVDRTIWFWIIEMIRSVVSADFAVTVNNYIYIFFFFLDFIFTVVTHTQLTRFWNVLWAHKRTFELDIYRQTCRQDCVPKQFSTIMSYSSSTLNSRSRSKNKLYVFGVNNDGRTIAKRANWAHSTY